MRKLKLFLSLLMLVAFSAENVWADNIDITTSALGLSGSSYASSDNGVAVGGVTIKFTDCNVTNGVCMKKSTGCIWNSSAMPQNIDSIVMSSVAYSSSSSAGFYVYGSTTAKGTTTKVYESGGTTGKIKIDFTSYSYKYFYIQNKGTRTTSSTSIKVYYTSGSGSNKPTV